MIGARAACPTSLNPVTEYARVKCLKLCKDCKTGDHYRFTAMLQSCPIIYYNGEKVQVCVPYNFVMETELPGGIYGRVIMRIIRYELSIAKQRWILKNSWGGRFVGIIIEKHIRVKYFDLKCFIFSLRRFKIHEKAIEKLNFCFGL